MYVCVFMYKSYLIVSMPLAGVLTPVLGLHTPLLCVKLSVSVTVPILGLNTLTSNSRTVTCYFCLAQVNIYPILDWYSLNLAGF